MKQQRRDRFFKYFFATFAWFSIVILFIITLFIFVEGIKPFIPNNPNGTISFVDFITGMKWDPQHNVFGIGYMIIATLLSTLLAIVLAVPLSILSAAAICELLPAKLRTLATSIIELLASIPSIIYGIFGLGIIVPMIAKLPFNNYPQGNSLLAVSIVLAIMIIPTITAMSINSIKAVPKYYKEASLGLGATKMQTLVKIILPVAKSGILAGVVLGIGRAIGETMAIVLVAGNVSGGWIQSIFSPIRPLTTNIAVDMSYATGLHKEVLFSTALVLFIFVFILNLIMQRILKKGK